MEDLSDYHIGDQIIGATLADTTTCIDELAKLHASFWNKVADIDWLPHIAGSQHAMNMQVGAQAGWDTMLKVFGVSYIQGWACPWISAASTAAMTCSCRPAT